MKIAFFEIQGWEKEILSEGLEDHELTFFEEPLTQDNVSQISDVDIISVFIYSSVDQTIIDILSDLKLITTRSTGFDHIDIDYCKKKEIVVSSVPNYGENTVAEHTFALILSLSRNVHKSFLRTTQGNFKIEGLKGFDIKGKTLGVVGTGHIGMHVIKIAKGFGMKVIAFDIKQNRFLEDLLNFTYVTLDELIEQSDIITLHVPYNKHTHHLINKNRIDQMKEGVILINTSRGGLVDTDALLHGIKEKKLGGIGLDVLEGEDILIEEKQLLYDPEKFDTWSRIVKDQILLRSENVVFTPHIAFYSQEALERIVQTTIENIQQYILGSPINQVK